MPKQTLEPQFLEHFYHQDIEELEQRASARANERAQHRVRREQDLKDDRFIRNAAAVVGATVLFGLGISHYNRMHADEPIHGPAVPTHTESLSH